MGTQERKFLQDSVISYNRKHRSALNHNISKYDQAVGRGKIRYTDLQEARQYASDIKDEALGGLAEYLGRFEKNITSRGARVLWALDGMEAIEHVMEILKENEIRLVVKSKSMVTEEVQLNEHLHKKGIETLETDLGEFIVQTAGEKPYHILTPAIHKSKEEIAALFHRKYGTPETASPAEIAKFVRNYLRTRFINAGVGITGANFLIADIGAVSITENEGNALLTVAFPKVHIVLAGIERLIPSVSQLPFFWQWLGVHGTGQNLSAYNTLITGPRTKAEQDGPEKMVVILVDNGRSRLYSDPKAIEALKCIRCGACLNACPVYRNIGGYTYATTYTGPIGSVITPFYSGFSDFGHLSQASTLCGRCTEVCPVKIHLHGLLQYNRQLQVKKFRSSWLWKAGTTAFVYTFGKRSRLDFLNGNTKKRLTFLTGRPFGKGKKMPVFADKSFSEIWKNQNL